MRPLANADVLTVDEVAAMLGMSKSERGVLVIAICVH